MQFTAIHSPRDDRALSSSIEHAGASFAGLVRRTPSRDWTSPTPCPDWDVADLIAHVVGVAETLVPMSQGNGSPPPIARDGLFGPRHTSERLLVAVHRGLDAWSKHDDANVREFPWGRTPVRRLYEFALVELVGHGWDLAQATGRPYRVPPTVVAAATTVVETHLSGSARDRQFAPPVHPRHSEDRLDVFAALLGRDVTRWCAGQARMESPVPDVHR